MRALFAQHRRQNSNFPKTFRRVPVICSYKSLILQADETCTVPKFPCVRGILRGNRQGFGCGLIRDTLHPGDSHAGDIGHWLRMTLCREKFFQRHFLLSRTVSGWLFPLRWFRHDRFPGGRSGKRCVSMYEISIDLCAYNRPLPVWQGAVDIFSPRPSCARCSGRHHRRRRAPASFPSCPRPRGTA